MNREQLKSCLERDKTFLKELFESDSVAKSKRILNFANDAELITLIKYLHFVSNGEIPIKKQNFEAVQKKHLKNIKTNFEKKTNVQQLLQNSRKEKVSRLIKLIPSFGNLLTPLFRE